VPRHCRGVRLVALLACLGLPTSVLLEQGVWAQDKPASKPLTTGAADKPASAGRKRSGKGGDDFRVSPELEDESLYNCGKVRGMVAVNFKPEVELKELITWAMGFTCRNFIYGNGIDKRASKVTVIAPKKMSPAQAWRVFLVSLSTMKLTLVPKGNVLEVVEAPQAKRDALPVYPSGTPTNSEQMVRVIMRPEHLPVDDLSAVLGELKSKDGEVKPLSKAGILVITDYGSHITKMTEVVREVDRPTVGESLYMIKVRYADAQELATKLGEIIGGDTSGGRGMTPRARNRRARPARDAMGGGMPGPGGEEEDGEGAVPSKIVADDRTNSLIMLASEPAYLRVSSLVKRLDIPTKVDGAGRIYVHHLENADAEELANTLTSVISGVSPAGGAAGERGSRGPLPPPPAPIRNSFGEAPAFEGQVRVTADKPTNSLVIIASAKDFMALTKVVEQLDTVRPQVYIEAVILEVSVENGRNLGVSYHGGDDFSDGTVVLGGVQHPDLKSLNPASLLASSTSTGLLGGAFGPILSNLPIFQGVSIPSFGVLFQAMALSSNVNVLSTPHILTTDNEEAELSVGRNVPYQSGFLPGLAGAAAGQQGAGGLAALTQGVSVQRQDVALTLKLTPAINASEMVRLKIDLEISDLGPDTTLGPTWTKRAIKDTVVVRDQQSVVIGGLMKERLDDKAFKVPLLGDIPLLGHLFKYTRKQKEKTNLLVILTPYIIGDSQDVATIVERKVREQREFLGTFTSFAKASFEATVDYRRKRGVLEEINRKVLRAEKEAQVLRDLDTKLVEYPDGPIEYKARAEGEESGEAAPGGAGPGETGEEDLHQLESQGELPRQPEPPGGKGAVQPEPPAGPQEAEQKVNQDGKRRPAQGEQRQE
jgi:general secretion pathway protein D